MNTIIRREILQGVRAGAAVRAQQKALAVAAGLSPVTPATPAFFPEQITNYHPTPRVDADGAREELYPDDRHTSVGTSSRRMSANSGRRLSDITAGDAEWKELQRQLKWEQP